MRTSRIPGRARSSRLRSVVAIWFVLGGVVFADAPEQDLVAAAEASIELGRLQTAIRTLKQALALDPGSVRARELRQQVEQRYLLRGGLLVEATELATVGKFARAYGNLEEAQRIDSEDEASLDYVRGLLEDLEKEFDVHNPPLRIAIRVGVGSLGVDENAVESQVAPVTPVDVRAATPLGVGLGSTLRFGRHFLGELGVGYGFSRNDGSTSFEKDVVEFWQGTAGVGLRTVRTATREYELGVSSGVALESARTSLDGNGQLDGSDTRVGLFVRLGVQWKKFGAQLAHGFGFDQDPGPGEAIGWSDAAQLSLAYTF